MLYIFMSFEPKTTSAYISLDLIMHDIWAQMIYIPLFVRNDDAHRAWNLCFVSVIKFRVMSIQHLLTILTWIYFSRFYVKSF